MRKMLTSCHECLYLPYMLLCFVFLSSLTSATCYVLLMWRYRAKATRWVGVRQSGSAQPQDPFMLLIAHFRSGSPPLISLLLLDTVTYVFYRTRLEIICQPICFHILFTFIKSHLFNRFDALIFILNCLMHIFCVEYVWCTLTTFLIL